MATRAPSPARTWLSSQTAAASFPPSVSTVACLSTMSGGCVAPKPSAKHGCAGKWVCPPTCKLSLDVDATLPWDRTCSVAAGTVMHRKRDLGMRHAHPKPVWLRPCCVQLVFQCCMLQDSCQTRCAEPLKAFTLGQKAGVAGVATRARFIRFLAHSHHHRHKQVCFAQRDTLSCTSSAANVKVWVCFVIAVLASLFSAPQYLEWRCTTALRARPPDVRAVRKLCLQ